jgi:hypothetical protein
VGDRFADLDVRKYINDMIPFADAHQEAALRRGLSLLEGDAA